MIIANCTEMRYSITDDQYNYVVDHFMYLFNRKDLDKKKNATSRNVHIFRLKNFEISQTVFTRIGRIEFTLEGGMIWAKMVKTMFLAPRLGQQ